MRPSHFVYRENRVTLYPGAVFGLKGAKFGEGSGDRLDPQSVSGRSPGGGPGGLRPREAPANVRADRKTKMAALTSDWLRHFLAFLAFE